MTAKVLVINTGGTFGMVPGEQGLAPAGDLEVSLKNSIADIERYNFDMVNLDPLIDSSDLRPSDWTRLTSVVLNAKHHYRGFLVIHGTDTLAYTSSALSFLLSGLQVPVVITGSQYPIGTENGDAEINFIDSMNHLLSGYASGVEVCFGQQILQGNRVCKVDAQHFEAFAQPNGSVMSRSDVQEAPRLFEFDDQAVATVLIYPGIPATLIDALAQNPRLKAIVLLSFGSGNIPTLASDVGAGLRRAVEKDILLINLTQCLRGHVLQGAYATGSLLAHLGALDGFDMTPEAAFAKAHYLLARYKDKKAVVAHWSQPLCGELTDRQ